jgi:hypothetical protein
MGDSRNLLSVSTDPAQTSAILSLQPSFRSCHPPESGSRSLENPSREPILSKQPDRPSWTKGSSELRSENHHIEEWFSDVPAVKVRSGPQGECVTYYNAARVSQNLAKSVVMNLTSQLLCSSLFKQLTDRHRQLLLL